MLLIHASGRSPMPTTQRTIATYNVNGIASRLPHLLQWLQREQPDIVGLQELKSTQEAFPEQAIRDAGYGVIWQGQRSWNGVALLARGADPVEIRRGLPWDPADTQSRYLEAAIHGVIVGCLYLPNGNPQPGPKFDYKLKWFQRLLRHAATLVALPHPVALIGDFNVVPTDAHIYDPKGWRKDALLQPESRAAYAQLLTQGWTDSLQAIHGDAPVYTFWDYFRQHFARDRGLRIDHLLLNRTLAAGLRNAGVDKWVRALEKASDHAPTWITVDVPDTDAVPAAAAGPARKRTKVKKAAANAGEKKPSAAKKAVKNAAKSIAITKTAARKAATKKTAAKKASANTASDASAAKKATPVTTRKASKRTTS
ncbi:exodeoxyribonuclease III [Xanthomonas campestris pv. campestris]